MEDAGMRGQGRILFIAALIACGFAAITRAEHAFRETAADGFTLRYEGDVPIATFTGSPEEVGKQHARLLGAEWQPLRDFAFGFLGFDNSDFRWSLLLGASNSLISHAPQSQQREIDAMCKAAGDDGDVVRVINCLPELRRFGCSTLIVEPERSSTGGPLFGRNLDFPTLGILEKYGLVMVFRVEGKRPFVSIALPGVVGVLSGINDAGLAVATLDSYQAADGSVGYEPAGVPLGFVFRQLLEECETVDQAEALLKSTKATTWMNLAVCDRERGAVFEITPKQVVRRNAEDAILPCTNHFRTPELVVNTTCSRYESLSRAALAPQLDVEMIRLRLDAANQGAMTFQTMVFEPRELKLHLSMGKLPSSAGPFQVLDLEELLSAGAR
jgi:hypothetical protein